ncbi:MAG: serine/threonine-protein kinase [Acidobacteriia bacterium]|nr:serine/threonine-protein kinase [Terriglobia bacterium]
MPLQPGLRLGPYEIIAPLGAGGMGEVYKARDTRLDRTVAVKVLPASLAADPERRERFEREARAVSALNHPNICTLYDIGHQDGVDYLVMELIEGESLESRLTKGPLPLDQVLRLGTEIADALSKAHRQGIVHRDLKPANVMLTKQGSKLLDFGLARVDAPATQSSVSFLPTQQQALTQAGTVLGTFQYMSPEQLEGRDADARTDIFAFGALLYEAMTARKAFEGKSQASLISSIMSSTPPPITTLQPMTPPALDRVIKTCLNKDPDERWQTAQDLAAELKWIADGGSQVGVPAPVVSRRKSRERWAWTAAAVFAIAAALTGARLLLQRDAPRLPTRFSVAPPKDVKIEWPRISPDGRAVAFVGVDLRGRRSIWVRPMDAFDAIHLDGTENVQRPFWSPDSRYLAFFANGQLKKVLASGGPTQLVCEFAGGSDGSWGRGVILFDGRATDPVRRVPDSGGVPEIAVKPDTAKQEVGTAWPFFLPDGRHYLFLSNNAKGPVTIKVASLDSPGVTVLVDSESRAEYSSGHIFYVAQRTLMARPFSPDKLAFTGEPFPVTDRIQIQSLGLVDFSTSQSGDLAYANDAQDLRNRLLWFDRAGKELGAVGEPALYRNPALSPDDTRAAVGVAGSGTGSANDDSIWVIDLKRNVSSRLTFGDGLRSFTVWSPDGAHVAYSSTGKNGPFYTLQQKLASGGGDESKIFESTETALLPTDWSPDGTHVLLTTLTASGDNFDLATIAADGSAGPVDLVKTPGPTREINGRFSPDGRWFAYQSNESGRYEIFVQAFPKSGGKWQISTAGGNVPWWRGDGKEIIYQGPEETFYAVTMRTAGAGFEIGVPVKLFQHRMAHGSYERNSWTVTRDGQRFLLIVPLDDNNARTIQVVLNWAAGLKK